MKLLHKDHPLLRTKTKFFDFDKPLKDPIELRNELIDEMFDSGGMDYLQIKLVMIVQYL